MGSWERVREWSHDRWGEPLEVEDLLPDYLAVGGSIRSFRFLGVVVKTCLPNRWQYSCLFRELNNSSSPWTRNFFCLSFPLFLVFSPPPPPPRARMLNATVCRG